MAAITVPTLTESMSAAMESTDQFIYPRVAPTCPVKLTKVVDEGEFEFAYYRRDAKNSRAVTEFDDVAPIGAEPTTVPDRLSDATATARQYALQKAMGLGAVNARDPMEQRDHEAVLSGELTNMLLIKREQRLVTYLKSATFTNGFTGASGTYWDTPTYDPMIAVQTGHGVIMNEGAGKARVFAMGYNVAVALSRNPNIRTLIGDGRISINELAQMIRDQIFSSSSEMRATGATDFEVIIGTATVDGGSLFGTTVTASGIWSNFAALLDVPPAGAGTIRREAGLYSADVRRQGSALSAGAPVVTIEDDTVTERRILRAKYSAGLFTPNEAKVYWFKSPVASPLM